MMGEMSPAWSQRGRMPPGIDLACILCWGQWPPDLVQGALSPMHTWGMWWKALVGEPGVEVSPPVRCCGLVPVERHGPAGGPAGQCSSLAL